MSEATSPAPARQHAGLPEGFRLEDLNLSGYPNRVVTVTWRQHGQARPYADSVYEAELTFTGRNISTKKAAGHFLVVGASLRQDMVEKFARLLVCDWGDGWSRLEKMERISEIEGAASTWLVRVVTPYSG